MTKECEEIEQNSLLSPKNSGEAYKSAVERIGKCTVEERELEPKLVSIHKETALMVDNPLEKITGSSASRALI